MKNIHVLKTDKPSRLYCYKSIDLYLHSEIVDANSININCQNQNIYITSDEEIKEGDWVYTPNKNTMLVTVKYSTESSFIIGNNNNEKSPYYIEFCKKIILTTDKELIKDGVQAIDDEFLEWFVKNPSCEEVEVVKEDWKDKTYSYETIIPKEETQGYICPQTKVQCNDEFCVSAEKCNLLPSTDVFSEPKQEKLEEASKNPINYTKETNGYIKIQAFKDGAKWQQEQIGKSEFLQKLRGTMSDAEARRLIFEQFKKK